MRRSTTDLLEPRVRVGKYRRDRFGPRHPQLAGFGLRVSLPILERLLRQKHIHRFNSYFAKERSRELITKVERGDKAYLAGISIGGFHNTGVALIEVSLKTGMRIICNNEEERFTGRKHTNRYPAASLEELRDHMDRERIYLDEIVAWTATYDYPLFAAAGIRSLLEEFPASMQLLRRGSGETFSLDQFIAGIRTPARLAKLFGLANPIPIIGMEHHFCHAWFSYLASPFAQDPRPVMIAVLDGSGDFSSISLYVGENGCIRQIHNNASIYDSLGMFYSVISSTQGGWTPLSSEGRYMGAAAFGDMERTSNRFYSPLRAIFSLGPEGDVVLNRSLANWPRSMLHRPYTRALTEILGEPISIKNMWNPDAVLHVENIRHQPQTRDRVDKAAATQMVFEDALIHIVNSLIRRTRSDRLVLTGGAALNAVANMRLLETFDLQYYETVLGQTKRLHLWVPPIPGDAGATVGAAYAFAGESGINFATTLQHAFYCGRSASYAELIAVLEAASDIDWMVVGDVSEQCGIDAIADLMAFITARDGIIAIFQGPAETGPRALGHRSILANARNPQTRNILNERVKYREAIRPLAPMATLAAARELFELSDGGSDDNYNVYNYMVLTARAKPSAWTKAPAVIHVDGTARLQIVREDTDPISHSYLTALGRRTGVEVAVNTSFNVAAPIAQTPIQAIDTVRRTAGMDGVFMFSEEGQVIAAWLKRPNIGADPRIARWYADWQAETGAVAAATLGPRAFVS
jgi:carbamoyltransferase